MSICGPMKGIISCVNLRVSRSNSRIESVRGLGYGAARWFPFDAQLLHALAILPYQRDVLLDPEEVIPCAKRC